MHHFAIRRPDSWHIDILVTYVDLALKTIYHSDCQINRFRESSSLVYHQARNSVSRNDVLLPISIPFSTHVGLCVCRCVTAWRHDPRLCFLYGNHWRQKYMLRLISLTSNAPFTAAFLFLVTNNIQYQLWFIARCDGSFDGYVTVIMQYLNCNDFGEAWKGSCQVV